MQRTCRVTVPKTGNLEIAERVTRVACQFQSRVTLDSPVFEADAKSFFGTLILSAARGMPVSITAEGPDAFSAVDALSDIFHETSQKAA